MARRDNESDGDYFKRIFRGSGPEDDEDRRHMVAAQVFFITGGAVSPHEIKEIGGKPYNIGGDK